MRRSGTPHPPRTSPSTSSTRFSPRSPTTRRGHHLSNLVSPRRRGPGLGSRLRGSTSFRGMRMTDYETLLVEKRGAVTLITLNRPKALNALNAKVLADLLAALAAFDAD